MKKHTRPALALEFARKGWAVLPLHDMQSGKCSCNARTKECKPGKHPRTRNGVHDATTDPARIRAWWRKWPDANIGIRTGAASSLLVLDVDSDDAQSVLDEALQSLGVSMPQTWTVRTGRGRHYYFAIPDGLVVKKPSLHGYNAISLQADDVYAVGVGSLHKSGRVYSWEHYPDDRPLAGAPDWLLDGEWASVVCKNGRAPSPVGLEGGNCGGDASPCLAPLRSERPGAGYGSAPLCSASPQNPIPTCEDHVDRVDRVDRVWLGDTPESLIGSMRLNGSGQTEPAMYSLVRGLKIDLGLSIADGLAWVRRWHAANAQHITHEYEWTVMEDKAMRAWANARVPLRSSAVETAMQRAKTGALPEGAGQFGGSPNTQLTIALCAQLQAIAPTSAFVLSARQLARALGHRQPDSAHTILRVLERAGWIECVKRGTQGTNGLATTWRYLGAPDTLSTCDAQRR